VVKIYRKDDAGYLEWRDAHPEGWVANSHASLSPGYVLFHRAPCPSAASVNQGKSEMPLTGGDYVKTVSDSLTELWMWAKATGFTGAGVGWFCGHCCKDAPVPAVPPPVTEFEGFGAPPQDDPEELQNFARRVRRGQHKFREMLLKAYGGACAITGHGPAAVLEAAHIEPHATSGRNGKGNGLLLRADLHLLFDARLLRIEPDSLEVELDESLRGTAYWELNGRPLRERVDGSRPSRKRLQDRKEQLDG